MSLLELTCLPPPAPMANGTYDWNGLALSIGTKVKYSCQKGRKLQKLEGNGSVTLHDSQTFECQSNLSWTSYAPVSSCAQLRYMYKKVPTQLSLGKYHYFQGALVLASVAIV